MIVRILGEGQFDVPDADRATLDELEEALNAAVDGDDEAGLRLRPRRPDRRGPQGRASRWPPDSFTSSDLVVPFADASLAETKSLLDEPGGERT